VILLNQAAEQHEHICDSLELFAKEVMPEFKSDPDTRMEARRHERRIQLEEIDTEAFTDRRQAGRQRCAHEADGCPAGRDISSCGLDPQSIFLNDSCEVRGMRGKPRMTKREGNTRWNANFCRSHCLRGLVGVGSARGVVFGTAFTDIFDDGAIDSRCAFSRHAAGDRVDLLVCIRHRTARRADIAGDLHSGVRGARG